MANEFYTLIVVPHAKARFRQAPGLGEADEVGRRRRRPHSALVADRQSWSTTPGSRSRSTSCGGCAPRTQTCSSQDAGVRAERRRSSRPRWSTSRGWSTKLGVMAGPGAVAPPDAARRRRGRRAQRRERWRRTLESRRPSRAMDREPHRPDRPLERSSRSSTRTRRVLLASTPSIWPVRGYLSAGFGNRVDPFTGQRDFHPGIDISTPIGTRVQAPADGVVVSARREGRLRQRDHHRPRLRDRHPLRPPGGLQREGRASGCGAAT